MNEKQARFAEICFAVDLLPDTGTQEWEDLDEKSIRLPNGTNGLDVEMLKALMSEVQKHDDEWGAKLYSLLCNTAMLSILDREGIEETDLYAFTIAASVAWVSREGSSMLRAIALLNHSLSATDLDCPPAVFALFDDPETAKGLSRKNPYDFLA